MQYSAARRLVRRSTDTGITKKDGLVMAHPIPLSRSNQDKLIRRSTDTGITKRDGLVMAHPYPLSAMPQEMILSRSNQDKKLACDLLASNASQVSTGNMY